MLRDSLSDRLKMAMKDRETLAVSTIRLILTAVKDRDIAARSKGETGGISDQEILQVLQTMVRQRDEAIALYRQGGRDDLADQEAEEIEIIRTFLPRQLGDDEVAGAVREAIDELSASSIKDMGRTMALLRERYAGQMDFAKAGALVKAELTGR